MAIPTFNIFFGTNDHPVTLFTDPLVRDGTMIPDVSLLLADSIRSFTTPSAVPLLTFSIGSHVEHISEQDLRGVSAELFHLSATKYKNKTSTYPLAGPAYTPDWSGIRRALQDTASTPPTITNIHALADITKPYVAALDAFYKIAIASLLSRGPGSDTSFINIPVPNEHFRRTNVCTVGRFILSLPPLIGMRDFIRIIDHSHTPSVGMTKEEGLLISPKSTTSCWLPVPQTSSSYLATYFIVPSFNHSSLLTDHHRLDLEGKEDPDGREGKLGLPPTPIKSSSSRTPRASSRSSARNPSSTSPSSSFSDHLSTGLIVTVTSEVMQCRATNFMDAYFECVKPETTRSGLRQYYIPSGSGITLPAALAVRFHSHATHHMFVVCFVHSAVSPMSVATPAHSDPAATFGTLSPFAYPFLDNVKAQAESLTAAPIHAENPSTTGQSATRTVAGAIPVIKGVGVARARSEILNTVLSASSAGSRASRPSYNMVHVAAAKNRDEVQSAYGNRYMAESSYDALRITTFPFSGISSFLVKRGQTLFDFETETVSGYSETK